MLDALAALADVHVWVLMIAGMVAGIIVGALPGLSPPMGIALALPFTTTLSPEPGLMLLGAIYVGAIWGGAITATLIRTPGTPAQVVTTLDAFPIAQQGQPKRALLLSLIASVHGGIVGVLALILLAPALARFALSFGPAEMLWVGLFGVMAIAVVAGDQSKGGRGRATSFAKAFLAGLFGMLLSTIGLDPAGGTLRFTAGQPGLISGIDLIVAMVGLFAFAQVIEMLSEPSDTAPRMDVRESVRLRTVWREVLSYPRTGVISSLSGVLLGVLPAAGATVASIVAYMSAKRYSRRPQDFGHGSAEGLVAAETANNACVGGSLVPTLALGVPGNASAAVLIGGLLIHGLVPGPRLFVDYADVTSRFFAGLLAAQGLLLVVGLVLVPIYSSILKVPSRNLAPVIAVLCFIGTFAVRNSIFDIYVMVVMGFIGYIGARRGFEPAPIVLGLILGGLIERSLLLSIQIGGASGSVLSFIFLRPISIGIIALMLAIVLAPTTFNWWLRRRGAAPPLSD